MAGKAEIKTDKPRRREYTVLSPVEFRGDIYRIDASIELTDEEAAHPLKIGAIKPKDAAE